MRATAELSGLTIGYEGSVKVGPMDLELEPGVTALLGRNGAGKTTLMRTLCGIIPPLGGSCTVLGHPVEDGAAVRSRIGYLGHESALASALTVEQNLSFWRDMTATYPGATTVSVAELVERFDLGTLMQLKVKQLSRGQRQRADLARLAMTDPAFIVLDEPLSGLDPVYAAQTRELLRQWGETRTVLYSTHSVPEALQIARTYLIIDGFSLVKLSPGSTPVTETEILAAFGAAA